MGEVERIAKGLSVAQRKAIVGAWHSTALKGWFIREGTRWDVRRRLVERGLLGKGIGNPLIWLGREVRDFLLRNPDD